jgi:hypothetical protein
MLKREGTFRVTPKSWTLEEYDSGSAAIAYELEVVQQYHTEDGGVWSEVWPDGYTTYHRAFIVKKDGSLNDQTIKRLVAAGLWDGDWGALEGPPPTNRCIVTVKEDEYNGRVSYKADWPQADTDTPQVSGSGFKPADPTLLASMRQRFGSATKAIVGKPATAGRPVPPPPGGQSKDDYTELDESRVPF